jgi:hypothetical protein
MFCYYYNIVTPSEYNVVEQVQTKYEFVDKHVPIDVNF